LDFDQGGHRSTLGEMIQMDGYFPIDEIEDRLPFRARTLRKWARKGPFTSCFMRVHIGPCGNSVLLVHLNLFAARFEELAEKAREEDSARTTSCDPSLDDISGLVEFAELTLKTRLF
jgi:hypothetical protein